MLSGEDFVTSDPRQQAILLTIHLMEMRMPVGAFFDVVDQVAERMYAQGERVAQD